MDERAISEVDNIYICEKDHQDAIVGLKRSGALYICCNWL